MNCKECRALFEEHLEGTLAPEREHALQEHLARCPSCRAEAGLFGSLRQHPPAGVEPPPAFRAGLEERIRRYEMLGPGGKEEVYLPEVRFYAGDDISFLRYTRYYLFKNYYRRKIYHVLGEYFPDRGALSLVAAVNALRERLEKEQGRKVPFREGLKTWHATEYETWRRDWEKAPEDSDFRFSTRVRHALGRLPAGVKILAAFAPFIILFLLLVFPAGAQREIHLAHHFLGEQRARLENALAAMGKKAGVRFRFTAMDEESLVFLTHHSGGYPVRALKPDLLLMEVNLLAYLGQATRFRTDSTPPANVPAGFPAGVQPLFMEEVSLPGHGLRDIRQARFPVFAAVMAGPDGRFPDIRTIRPLLRRYRAAWRGEIRLTLSREGARPLADPVDRGENRLTLQPLYRVYGLAVLTGLPEEMKRIPDLVVKHLAGGTEVEGLPLDWTRRILFDPQAYPEWRLTFPEYRIYGLLSGSSDRQLDE